MGSGWICKQRALSVFPSRKVHLHVLLCAKVKTANVARVRSDFLVHEQDVSLEMLTLVEGVTTVALMRARFRGRRWLFDGRGGF